MMFLVALFIPFALALAIPHKGGRREVRDAARIAMGVAFVFAGASHLLLPTPFVQHLPTWVPERHALIYVTGLVEIGLGLALFGPRQYWSLVGTAVALYLVAVFPSNVYVAVFNVAVDGQPGGWYAWARLPFQVMFVAWALWSTQAVSAVPSVERLGAPTPLSAGQP